MEQLVKFIPLFPLIGFAIIGLANRNLSKSITGFLATSTVLASFVISVMIFMNRLGGDGQAITVTLFDWISAGSFSAKFSFLVDNLSTMFLLVITGVGTLIHLYSVGYMQEDDGFRRFMSYMNLFIFFMLLLVLGDNYLVMFIGWEGVGLCSYLLIGFWFKNIEYSSAAKKAFIMNRIGDLGLLLGVLLIFTATGSVNYNEVFAKASTIAIPVVTTATILLFIGAMGKSAQIPLYTWLPDAMAGPTPVSALIHAATMVTAGVYMVARSSVLYNMAPISMDLVAWTGVVTALFAASIGFAQTDIKKVLAYSTVSQLGFMFAALGVGAFSAGVFHVVTHAFFKALLFLAAGSVIHAMHHEQDIRNMGGLAKKLPITHATFLLGYLAIIGFPFFAGYYSKDEIIIQALANKPIIGYLLIFGALMTAFYMSRLYFLTFWGKFRGTEEQEHHLHESPFSMTIPLMVLATLSVIGGSVLQGYMEHNLTMGSSVLASPLIEEHHLHGFHNIMMGVTAAVIVLAIYAFFRYVSQGTVPSSDSEMTGLEKTVYNKYYVDEIYETSITKPLNSLSSFLSNWIDINIIDRVVNGFGDGVKILSSQLRLTQSGSTGFYIVAMVIGMVLIFAMSLFR
ncbi:MAG: NADH-quinone oxidoreductase subunit L [Saprospiraceae bacterium]